MKTNYFYVVDVSYDGGRTWSRPYGDTFDTLANAREIAWTMHDRGNAKTRITRYDEAGNLKVIKKGR